MRRYRPPCSLRVRLFTLIELMIVVFIIAVIAAIAIPNLLESKKAANETNAVTSLKSAASAEEIYRTNDYSWGNRAVHKTYAQSFRQLGGSMAHLKMDGSPLALIPGPLADAVSQLTAFQGYFLSDIAADVFGNGFAASDHKFGYAMAAYPAQYDRTGSSTFLIDSSGAVRMRDLGGQSVPGQIVQVPDSTDPLWTSP